MPGQPPAESSIELIRISIEDAQSTCEAALARHGASLDHSAATARSVVVAEAEGNRVVGLAHLFDYCAALAEGRADGRAEPEIERAAGNVIRVDAHAGLPHLGLERAWDELVATAHATGTAILALRNGYTCGGLGYFARRLAGEAGLAALVAANAGPAVMPASGGRRPVFCTNPIAFAMPSESGGSIVIDQSSTAGAMVGIRQALEAGRPIPSGWALDRDGKPTSDPAAALEGLLLPFGGARGGNIALMVELMAAGLTGGNWSHRAAAYNAGSRSPGVGLFILAIDPRAAGGPQAPLRVDELLAVLRQEEGVHVPGLAKGARAEAARRDGIEVAAELWRRVVALAE